MFIFLLTFMDDITKKFSEEFYELGKKHMAETIWNVPALAFFIDQRWFTCDQLQELIRAIEEIKWSDYESFDDSDRSDELREFRDND